MGDHGRSRYVTRGCRCAVCVAASRSYARERRLRLVEFESPTHGLNGYKNYSCRCDVCRAACSADNAARRKRKAAASEGTVV